MRTRNERNDSDWKRRIARTLGPNRSREQAVNLRDDLWIINSSATSPADTDEQWSWKRGADAVRDALILAILDMPNQRFSRGYVQVDENQFDLAREQIIQALKARA